MLSRTSKCGIFSVANSHRIVPKENKSAFSVRLWPWICSGAIHGGLCWLPFRQQTHL